MLLIDAALVVLSFCLTPYLMILAGLGAGVFGFIMMHYILHQRWAKKAFPRLVRYHIVHHCKEPDMCFGVTVTWWDRILGTTPKKNKLIPDRVISFFYEKEKSSGAKIRVLPIVDEKLTSA
jgi:sterol desaturase/sphingolipid hydroxylase (fatty acid hydroxylase superfamily)